MLRQLRRTTVRWDCRRVVNFSEYDQSGAKSDCDTYEVDVLNGCRSRGWKHSSKRNKQDAYSPSSHQNPFFALSGSKEHYTEPQQVGVKEQIDDHDSPFWQNTIQRKQPVGLEHVIVKQMSEAYCHNEPGPGEQISLPLVRIRPVSVLVDPRADYIARLCRLIPVTRRLHSLAGRQLAPDRRTFLSTESRSGCSCPASHESLPSTPRGRLRRSRWFQDRDDLHPFSCSRKSSIPPRSHCRCSWS